MSKLTIGFAGGPLPHLGRRREDLTTVIRNVCFHTLSLSLISLLSAYADSRKVKGEYQAYSRANPVHAVRKPTGPADGHWQLFDFQSDRAANNDMSAQNPSIIDSMVQQWNNADGQREAASDARGYCVEVASIRKFAVSIMQSIYDALDAASFVAMSAGDAARFGPRPGRDRIGVEDARSPCQHPLAVRFRNANAGWVAQRVRAYQSADIACLILTL